MGVSFGGRVGLPTGVIAPELEIRGDVRISGWVLTLCGRGAPGGGIASDDAPPGYEYTDYAFALLAGRHFSIAEGALTLSAGAAVAAVGQETNDGALTHRGHLARVGGPIRASFWRAVASHGELRARHRAAPLRFSTTSTRFPFPLVAGALRLGVAGDVP